MPWVRIDDHYDEHPKFSKAGPLGMAMWLAGLAYCNRNLTDGFIPWSKARALMSWEFLGPETNDRGEHMVYTVAVTSGMSGDDATCEFVIRQLIYAGLWDEADGGYRIHDYLDYQPSKQQIEDERRQKQAAGQAGGRASAQARAQAPARAPAAAPAQAKSKPVPKPVPKPVSGPGPFPPPADAGGPPAPEFSDAERDLIEEIETTLTPLGLALSPPFWRKVLDAYGSLALGMEAYKQADWLRRHHKRIGNATRYTNWLDRALHDRDERNGDLPADQSDGEERPRRVCADCGEPTTVFRGAWCPECYERQKQNHEAVTA